MYINKQTFYTVKKFMVGIIILVKFSIVGFIVFMEVKPSVATMYFHVLGEVIGACKALVAQSTDIRLDSRVGPSVTC